MAPATRPVRCRKYAYFPCLPGSGRYAVPLRAKSSSVVRRPCSPVLLVARARTTPSGVPTYASYVSRGPTIFRMTTASRCVATFVMNKIFSPISKTALSDLFAASRSHKVRRSGPTWLRRQAACRTNHYKIGGHLAPDLPSCDRVRPWRSWTIPSPSARTSPRAYWTVARTPEIPL